MNIEKKLDGNCLTFTLQGRLDTNTALELEAELQLDGVSEVVFDLTDLEYISSAGLRIFLSAQKKMMATDGKVVLQSPNAMVRSVLDITGCADIFEVK